MDIKTLIADPAVLQIEKIAAEKSSLKIFVKSVQKQVCCPICRHISVKRHSSYKRCLADLPWQGVSVKLCLSARRFFCTNDLCARKIFAERLPKVVADFARRTLRLNEALTAVAFSVGGEAGRKLAEKLGLFVSELLNSSAEIKQAVALTRKFREIVKTRNLDLFEEWFREAEKLGTKWKNFVKGLRQDGQAVRAAITSEWSNGQTEGQVNRLKFLKRQMYGRAKFDLLRARVLYRGQNLKVKFQFQ